MSNYIVGDIQGCFDELKLLLKQVKFNANNDVIWVVDNLVAIGHNSLKTLRFIKIWEAVPKLFWEITICTSLPFISVFTSPKKDNTGEILN